MLVKEQVDFSKTKNIIVASIILVIGIGGLVLGFGGVKGANVISISGTAVAMVFGIVANLVLKDRSAEWNLTKQKVEWYFLDLFSKNFWDLFLQP